MTRSPDSTASRGAPPPAITELLQSWSAGDDGALEALMPLIYGELCQLASRHLRRERPGHTLQTRALVHEAFLRLVQRNRLFWEDRHHFFGIATRVMRRILVDSARRRRAAKRHGGPVLSLEEHRDAAHGPDWDLIELDRALSRLARFDRRVATIIELRFFGGFTVEEVARQLGVSPATVKRDAQVGRAWLGRELAGRGPDG